MSLVNIVKAFIEDLPERPPEWDLVIDKTRVSFKETIPQYAPNWDEATYIEQIMNNNVRYVSNGMLFNKPDEQTIYTATHREILKTLFDIYNCCCPNKGTRTGNKKIKNFGSFLNNTSIIDDHFDTVMNIIDYYMPIENTLNLEKNKVHKDNIFVLLDLMEKRYGKKSSNG
jgi:hypothetical protein